MKLIENDGGITARPGSYVHGGANTKEKEHKHVMSHAEKFACTTPVHITEETELKPGGALYRGTLPKEAQEVIQRDLGGTRTASHEHSRSAKQMKEMEGAHSIHQGLRGGTVYGAQSTSPHRSGLFPGMRLPVVFL